MSAALARKLALAVALFVAAVLAPRLLGLTPFAAVMATYTWIPHFVVKTSLVGLGLAMMLVSGGTLSDWGFRKPFTIDPGSIALGALLGALATISILLTPAKGLPWLVRDLGLTGIVIWIWFYSSVTEEIFVRGWFQGALARDTPLTRRARVVWSGVFFGGMHLTLLLTGADWMTVAILLAATTLLGLVTARSRERSGSLLPPILAHIAFNVASAVAGVVTAIVIYATTGRLPAQ
jgi:membrane protease YdiL (CAAX protease family)